MTHAHSRAGGTPGDGKYVHSMLCGAQCVIWEDGTTEPPGFDFYLFEHGARASCEGCKKALRTANR